MKVLCFDIGGTNIKYGIIEDGVILEKNQTYTINNIDVGSNIILEIFSDVVYPWCTESIELKRVFPTPSYEAYVGLTYTWIFKVLDTNPATIDIELA